MLVSKFVLVPLSSVRGRSKLLSSMYKTKFFCSHRMVLQDAKTQEQVAVLPVSCTSVLCLVLGVCLCSQVSPWTNAGPQLLGGRLKWGFDASTNHQVIEEYCRRWVELVNLFPVLSGAEKRINEKDEICSSVWMQFSPTEKSAVDWAVYVYFTSDSARSFGK